MSDADAAITRRRVLYGVGALATASGAWWFTGGTESAEAYGGPAFCPSESELQEMAWVRGRFAEPKQTVEPGVSFTSTLELHNDGGEAGTYDATIVLVEDESNLAEDGEGVNIRVPAGGEMAQDVALTPPEDFSGGLLQAPSLGSTCDLVRPAAQILEVGA